jgi:hypothetical protein
MELYSVQQMGSMCPVNGIIYFNTDIRDAMNGCILAKAE